MLTRCGEEKPDSIGLSEASESVNDIAGSVVFRWTKRLELTAADMGSGLQVCWKTAEKEGTANDSMSYYSASFGTVLIRGTNPLYAAV